MPAPLSTVAASRWRVAELALSAAVVGAILVTGLVVSGWATGFDRQFREWFRPHDSWGSIQRHADWVVEGLRPTHALLMLGVVTVVMSWANRSWRPAALVGAVGLFAVSLTYAGKELVGRPDPHGAVFVGSYPSGHTLSIMIATGLCVLLIAGHRGTPWALCLSSFVGLAMGVSLLLQAAHWATDVIGAALLALAIVGYVGTSRWLRPWLEPRPTIDGLP